ncbi:hypothetical protein C8R44DRAFT_843082, partial [Mycena epipterygia]
MLIYRFCCAQGSNHWRIVGQPASNSPFPSALSMSTLPETLPARTQETGQVGRMNLSPSCGCTRRSTACNTNLRLHPQTMSKWLSRGSAKGDLLSASVVVLEYLQALLELAETKKNTPSREAPSIRSFFAHDLFIAPGPATTPVTPLPAIRILARTHFWRS